jgi:YD repeat-containing protein
MPPDAPSGGCERRVFDAAGRQVAYQNANNRLFTTLYDADGRKTTVLDGNVAQLIRVYDALGRAIILVQATSAGAPVATIVDAYDAAGRKVVTSRNGVPNAYAFSWY